MRFLSAVVTLAALANMLIALAALGGGENPRLDLLTHLALPTALLALLTLGVDLWLRKGQPGAAALLSAVALVACGVLMGPELAAKARLTPAVKADETALRVMQFNLWRGNVKPEKAAEVIRKSGADVVVTVETFQRSQNIPSSVADIYPYRARCACAIAILSRWPIIEDSVQRDTRRPVQADPSIIWATIRTPHGDVTVIGNHFTWPTNPPRQAWQTRVLLNTAAYFDKRDLIVTGDFNSTPWSFFLKRQDKALGLERRTRGVSSWPAGHVSDLNLPSLFPLLPIDHVYAGSDWRTVSVKRGPRAGSDHYPVIVTLARKTS